MKALLSLILFILWIQPLFAQKETNNWFYGLNLGHTFVNGNPQPLSGILNGPYNGNGGFVWVISLTDKDGQKDSIRGIVVLTR